MREHAAHFAAPRASNLVQFFHQLFQVLDLGVIFFQLLVQALIRETFQSQGVPTAMKLKNWLTGVPP